MPIIIDYDYNQTKFSIKIFIDLNWLQKYKFIKSCQIKVWALCKALKTLKKSVCAQNAEISKPRISFSQKFLYSELWFLTKLTDNLHNSYLSNVNVCQFKISCV